MALGFLCVFTLNHSSSRYIFHELHLITLLVWLSRHNLMQDLKRQLLLFFFFLSSSSCAFMAVVLCPVDVRQRLEINATRSKTVFFLFCLGGQNAEQQKPTKNSLLSLLQT